MGKIVINLRQYIREKEAEQQRDITWAEIREATGIAESTLNRLLSHKAQRPDIEVLGKLCKFFDVPPGPVPFIVYAPDDSVSVG